ncbi:MAG: hypothetical protein IJP96_11135 [Synergistaceae bacterium]|nr:hypothetical protein [Synergistaceae bacterium]MBR0033420.1 hypothetical protein [Bacilli bacterium]MBR0076295.1 hypothetical protein [Synergistaceae bacterium]
MSDKKLYEHLPETIEVMIDGKHHSLKGYKVWEPIEADGTFTGSFRFITHIGAKDWEQKSAIENDMTAHPKKYIPEIVTTHRVFCKGDIYVFPPKVTSAHYDASNKQENEQ